MVRRLIILLSVMLFCAICGYLSRSCARQPSTWRTYRTFAFNTDCTLELDVPDEARANDAAGKCLRLMAEINDTLNRFDASSDISAFNGTAAGIPFSCDDILWRAFSCARIGYDLTNGLFDVTIGPLTRYWKEIADGKAPDDALLREIQGSVGFEKLHLDAANHTVTKLTDEMSVDFGGLAKGMALDMVSEMLLADGIDRFILNFGGNIHIHHDGLRKDDVAVSNPLEASKTICLITGCNGKFIATSSNAYRSLSPDKISHIIDPKTGTPIQALLSATAVAESGSLSDIFSTAIFIGGDELARHLVAEIPGTGFVLLHQDCKIQTYGDIVTQ